MTKMKLTIYSFKTFEDLKTLRERFGYLGVNIMFDEANHFVRHTTDSVCVFKAWMASAQNLPMLCNNGDMVNYMLGWCEENDWDAEVVYCSDGKIDTAPMVEGYLTNWPYGWYIPE